MNLFKGSLAIVPNCSWTGHECDLLIVDKSLRCIDIEVKISRADFKADTKKDKWHKQWEAGDHLKYWNMPNCDRDRLDWPKKIWKHYFAIPRDIWDESLIPFLPSACCGVIVIGETRDGKLTAWVKKPAKPNRKAEQISAADAINIARLASYRMWDALIKLDQLKQNNNK